MKCARCSRAFTPRVPQQVTCSAFCSRLRKQAKKTEAAARTREQFFAHCALCGKEFWTADKRTRSCGRSCGCRLGRATRLQARLQ